MHDSALVQISNGINDGADYFPSLVLSINLLLSNLIIKLTS